jgi:hypothetical protein
MNPNTYCEIHGKTSAGTIFSQMVWLEAAEEVKAMILEEDPECIIDCIEVFEGRLF